MLKLHLEVDKRKYDVQKDVNVIEVPKAYKTDGPYMN